MDESVGKPPKQQRRVFLNTLFSVLSKTQSALFSYVSLRMLLAAMSVEEYGFYTVLFQAALMNLSMLFQFGVPSLLVRYLSEFYTQGKFKMIQKLIRKVSLIQLAVWSALLLMVFLWADALVSLLHFPGTAAHLRIFSVGMVAFLLQENYRTILSSLFRHRTVFWVLFAYNVSRLAALYYVTEYDFSLQSVILAEVSVLILGLLFYGIYYRKELHKLIAQDPHADENLDGKKYLRYTGLSYLNEIGVLAISGLDLFFVSGLMGAAAAGLYGLANRILGLVNGVMPSTVLKSLIEPLFFSEFASSGKKSMELGFSMLTKLIAFVTLPAAAWLAVMANPVIVHLFEAKFSAASTILIILSAYLFLMNVKVSTGLILQTAERVDLLIYVKILGVIKIIAAIVLIPEGNILTMAWITVAISFLEISAQYFFMIKFVGVAGDLLGLARLILNGILSAIIFLPAAAYFDSLSGVLLSVPVFALLFLALCYFNKPFTSTERDWLNKKLKKPLWIF